VRSRWCHEWKSGDLRALALVFPDPICRIPVLDHLFRGTCQKPQARLTFESSIRGQYETSYKREVAERLKKGKISRKRRSTLPSQLLDGSGVRLRQPSTQYQQGVDPSKWARSRRHRRRIGWESIALLFQMDASWTGSQTGVWEEGRTYRQMDSREWSKRLVCRGRCWPRTTLADPPLLWTSLWERPSPSGHFNRLSRHSPPPPPPHPQLYQHPFNCWVCVFMCVRVCVKLFDWEGKVQCSDSPRWPGSPAWRLKVLLYGQWDFRGCVQWGGGGQWRQCRSKTFPFSVSVPEKILGVAVVHLEHQWNPRWVSWVGVCLAVGSDSTRYVSWVATSRCLV